MVREILVACTLLYATDVSAQPCKSFYPVGDPLPPGCAKAFDKWGDGRTVQPSRSVPPPTIEDNAGTFYPYRGGRITAAAPLRIPLAFGRSSR